MTTLVVVGASLAGLSTARAARAQGFSGRIVVVGEEAHHPYDRPPLSKGFLTGSVTVADLALESDDEGLDIEWMLGRRALQLDAAGSRIILDGGEWLSYDHLIIATGARAREIALPGSTARGVHILRSVDDAELLREDLIPGTRLVVIGAGFIGAEVASTAHGLGLEVTVLEAAVTPLAGPLGETMGAVVASLHERHGVRLRCGVVVEAIATTSTVDEQEQVTGVQLADGTEIPADVVVGGVGAIPNVEWLHASGLEIYNGVVCDEQGLTDLPAVGAVGDCANWFDPRLGAHRRVEHWTGAMERPAITVAALLGTGTSVKPAAPPYFWSDQYGSRIQFAGTNVGASSVDFEEGSADSASFLVIYRNDNTPIGVLGLNAGRSFTKWRRALTAPASTPQRTEESA